MAGDPAVAKGVTSDFSHRLTASHTVSHLLLHTPAGDPAVAKLLIHAETQVGAVLPTGARGSELKQIHLQSIRHERIELSSNGTTYSCVKVVAFETRTKLYHINQLLPHSHPWRCAIGLLGRACGRARPFFSLLSHPAAPREWQSLFSSASSSRGRLRAA